MSFSIGQKFENFLLIYIKQYFGITTKLIEQNNEFFVIEVYKYSVIESLILHFTNYSLLGEKQNSFSLFKKAFLSRKI